MTLKEFANIYLNGLYDPRISDESQSSGWYHLKSLVENKTTLEELTEEKLIPFHVLIREYIKANWYRIYGMKIG